jgi:hypothetical protein
MERSAKDARARARIRVKIRVKVHHCVSGRERGKG